MGLRYCIRADELGYPIVRDGTFKNVRNISLAQSESRLTDGLPKWSQEQCWELVVLLMGSMYQQTLVISFLRQIIKGNREVTLKREGWGWGWGWGVETNFRLPSGRGHVEGGGGNMKLLHPYIAESTAATPPPKKKKKKKTRLPLHRHWVTYSTTSIPKAHI